MQKCDVNGANPHEVYRFLRQNSSLYDASTKKAGEIPWNFAKFLVDNNGTVLKYYSPQTDPNDIVKDFPAE